MVCSRNQLAPEALSRNEYSTASDVWSVAVMIWELLTGNTLLNHYSSYYFFFVIKFIPEIKIGTV